MKFEPTYQKLKTAIKREWLQKLRSGKYKQSRGFLRGQHGYCCLGVLTLCKNVPKTFDRHTLSEETLEFCNLTLASQRKLIGLNDHSHRNFHYIADWIEKNL